MCCNAAWLAVLCCCHSLVCCSAMFDPWHRPRSSSLHPHPIPSPSPPCVSILQVRGWLHGDLSRVRPRKVQVLRLRALWSPLLQEFTIGRSHMLTPPGNLHASSQLPYAGAASRSCPPPHTYLPQLPARVTCYSCGSASHVGEVCPSETRAHLAAERNGDMRAAQKEREADIERANATAAARCVGEEDGSGSGFSAVPFPAPFHQHMVSQPHVFRWLYAHSLASLPALVEWWAGRAATRRPEAGRGTATRTTPAEALAVQLGSTVTAAGTERRSFATSAPLTTQEALTGATPLSCMGRLLHLLLPVALTHPYMHAPRAGTARGSALSLTRHPGGLPPQRGSGRLRSLGGRRRCCTGGGRRCLEGSRHQYRYLWGSSSRSLGGSSSYSNSSTGSSSTCTPPMASRGNCRTGSSTGSRKASSLLPFPRSLGPTRMQCTRPRGCRAGNLFTLSFLPKGKACYVCSFNPLARLPWRSKFAQGPAQ